MAEQRRLLPVALALCLSGCGAGEPALGPPPPPPAEPPATVESPTTPEPATAPPQPAAESPKPAQELPKAPEPLVWRKVDLGNSSAEMPDPVEMTGSDEATDRRGRLVGITAKVSKSWQDWFWLEAGDGESALLDDALVRAIMGPYLVKTNPGSNARRAPFERAHSEADGIVYERFAIKDGHGAETIAWIKIWPRSNRGPRRVAWRMSRISLLDAEINAGIPNINKFLGSLGKFPKPKPKYEEDDDS